MADRNREANKIAGQISEAHRRAGRVGAWAAGLGFIGALVGGPLGAAIGGTIGSFIGASD